MSKEIPFLQCIVEIRSDKTLEEVAELVSARLLGGIRFVGRDRFVYDEVPAISRSTRFWD